MTLNTYPIFLYEVKLWDMSDRSYDITSYLQAENNRQNETY